MSTARLPAVAPLVAGQRLGQEEFHERYKAMPPGVRAELIGGVVYMPSPVGDRHSIVHFEAVGWLWCYISRTPGVSGGDTVSTILDDLAEVQPDALLRIKPELGGQTRKAGPYIGGAPELVIEVASSSRAIDLGPKLADYERAGALEYIVFAINPDEVYWHVRQGKRLIRIEPDADGLYRSKVFPGLWLDPVALFNEDRTGLIAAVERGLVTQGHADFVARLSNTENAP